MFWYFYILCLCCVSLNISDVLVEDLWILSCLTELLKKFNLNSKRLNNLDYELNHSNTEVNNISRTTLFPSDVGGLKSELFLWHHNLTETSRLVSCCSLVVVVL